ncbi:MAG: metal-dependent transcriptional regulator [Caldisericota bacterium]|nr:metal-dependent transcriptional regulator [Caldisericota bacterium]
MNDTYRDTTTEDREECLEALCRLEQAHRFPTAAELASIPDLSGRPLADLLLDLAMSGHIRSDGSVIRLSREGRRIGQRIVRRHTVAERVLCLLGLRRDKAHEEACKLEHMLPDNNGVEFERRMELVAGLVDLGAITLAQAMPGTTYRVRWIRSGSTVRRRLEDMGLGQGTTVTVCNRQHGGPVEVEARGACVALGRGVAAKILVTPEAH